VLDPDGNNVEAVCHLPDRCRPCEPRSRCCASRCCGPPGAAAATDPGARADPDSGRRDGAQNTEIAILSALVGHPPPGIYDPRRPMPRDTYEQMVWELLPDTAGRGWIVESRDPGRVVAKIERDEKYLLRVQVRYDERVAAVSIVDVTGILAPQQGRLHRKAVAWIQKLEQRIRTELQRFGAVDRRAG
jgi:hypothetical protein